MRYGSECTAQLVIGMVFATLQACGGSGGAGTPVTPSGSADSPDDSVANSQAISSDKFIGAVSNNSGEILVLTTHDASSETRAIRYAQNDGWEAPVKILDADAVTSATPPTKTALARSTLLIKGSGALGLADYGDAAVVWQGYNKRILARARVGGVWQPTTLLSSTGVATVLSLAVDPSGTAVAAVSWIDYNAVDDTRIARTARFLPSSGWEIPTDIPVLVANESDIDASQLATDFDTTGNLYVVARTDSILEGNRRVALKFSKRFADGSWASPQLISVDQANELNSFAAPSLAVTANGDAFVAHELSQSPPTTAVRVYTFNSKAASWSDASDITFITSPGNVDLIADGVSGNVAMISGGEGSCFASSQGWSAVTASDMSAAPASAWSPCLKGANGVTWNDSGDGIAKLGTTQWSASMMFPKDITIPEAVVGAGDNKAMLLYSALNSASPPSWELRAVPVAVPSDW